MVYNLTNVTGANDLNNIIYATNEATGYLLVNGLMLILFITFLVVFKKQSFKKVILADAFFMVLISSFAFTLGWVGFQILIVPIILLFASVVIYYFIQ